MDSDGSSLKAFGIANVKEELWLICHASVRAAFSLTRPRSESRVKPRSVDCYLAHARYLRLLLALGAEAPSDALGTDAFVRHYLTRPFVEWFPNQAAVTELARSISTETAFPLLYVDRQDRIHPYDPEALDDLNERQCNLEELQEDEVFHEMFGLSQEGYVAFRLFEIENPLLHENPEKEFRSFVFKHLMDHLDNPAKVISEVISVELPNHAYEEIPDNHDFVICPTCGWTYDPNRVEGPGRPCACVTSWSTRPNLADAKPVEASGLRFRLRWGPMQWHCLPGKLEVRLAKEATDLGFDCELWPNHDFCDLKVDLGSEVLYVDVKVYSDIGSLSSRIATEVRSKLEGTPLPPGSRFVFVVPSSRYDNPAEAVTLLRAVAGNAAGVLTDIDFMSRLRKTAVARNNASGGDPNAK